jgi:hypothetical protein
MSSTGVNRHFWNLITKKLHSKLAECETFTWNRIEWSLLRLESLSSNKICRCGWRCPVGSPRSTCTHKHTHTHNQVDPMERKNIATQNTRGKLFVSQKFGFMLKPYVFVEVAASNSKTRTRARSLSKTFLFSTSWPITLINFLAAHHKHERLSSHPV